MIELYAITDHPRPPLPEVVPLRAVSTRALTAVCAPASESEVTADSLWGYERVVEALMDECDLLPVRYGTRLPDEAAVAAVLEARYDQLRQSLDFVRGGVEVSVRVASVAGQVLSSSEAHAGSGTDYLRARAREVAVETDAAQVVHEPLSALARAATIRPTSLPGEVLRAAYLVNQAELEDFTALVRQLQDHNPTLRLTCTGPWPPYSFAQP